VAYEYDRRTPRYSLVTCIEMTDPLSEIQVRARTKMLSMSGCGVESSMLFTKGTIVRIKLSHHDAEVRAVGGWYIPISIWEWVLRSPPLNGKANGFYSVG
jgi:hypothetical protein